MRSSSARYVGRSRAPPVMAAIDCGVKVSYSSFQCWTKSASKMMSASRIWPVIGFTRGAHGKTGAGGDPAERVVGHVFRIPVGVIRLLADFNRIHKSGLLIGL